MCLNPNLGQAAYPEPPPPADTTLYGHGIQRTLQKLARSSEENGEVVRILFYGQSIIGQRWHTLVEEDLRRRFPDALLEVENLALGGFSSQRLVRTAPYDVLPYYPDLFVFHVFGNDVEYEQILRMVRAHTTAEILIQTDHANFWPDDQGRRNKARWSRYMNDKFLPRMSERYATALQPQQAEWIEYLETHDMQPPALLADNVHLNEHGRWLMAELLKRFLVLHPEATPEAAEWITTHPVGADIRFEDRVLELEFEGNRVEVLTAAPALETPPLSVTINGKQPSQYPQLHYHARPSRTPLIEWPAIKKIDAQAPLQSETWTLHVTDFNHDASDFTFSLEGSVTGPDGAGKASEDFVSDSGRVCIEARDWVFAYARSVGAKKNKGVWPESWTVTWQTTAVGLDAVPLVSGEPAWQVLASGLPAGTYSLRLKALNEASEKSVFAVRVHRPPLMAGPIEN
ncbi:MAG: SGNH/GDSL hydrolase family protein [Opitutales bacterium]